MPCNYNVPRKLLPPQTNECRKFFQQSGDVTLKDVPFGVHHGSMSWRWEHVMEHVTSLAASLHNFAHRRIVVKLLVFSIGITLVDVHLNWLNWFHFLFIERGLFIILINCIILLSLFPDSTRMSMSTVSSPRTVRLCIFLPVECFP